ncbi:MAG: hypothetical protein LBD41_02130, partial [Clostridiales Family XIII bacterium]|nr:hypothetical protein [Clostridiales Family XIII bacterium]
ILLANRKKPKAIYRGNPHQRKSMGKQVCSLIKFIENLDGKADKAKLSKLVQNEFGLTKDRTVFRGYIREIAPRVIPF